MTVTLRSVVRRSSVPVGFHVWAPDFSAREKEGLHAALNHARGDSLAFIDLAPLLPRLHRIGARETTYHRLLLAEALPKLDRLLYLDSDLLVRTDVAELWARIEAGRGPVQACLDVSPCVTAELLPLQGRWAAREGAPYYNAGVLGLNLQVWRETGALNELLAYLHENGNVYPFLDQGAINAVFGREIEPLPEDYNRFALWARPSARIVHYCTFRKPFVRARRLFQRQDWALALWQVTTASSFHWQEYFEVLDDTVHGGWRPWSLQTALLKATPSSWVQTLRTVGLRGPPGMMRARV